jgi:hypothetical protein
LILLGCLGQKRQNREFQPLYIRMMVGITKLKQELEDLGGFCESNDFVARFELWWSETFSADFQIYLVYPKEDTVARLKCDIRVRRTDYMVFVLSIWQSLSGFSTYSGPRQLQVVLKLHSDN